MLFEEDGSLCVERLEKELSGAIFEDKRYHNVDEMKKRSVLTCKDYDEFKNKVACAQDMLKPVTSAELADLGRGVPGWRKKKKKKTVALKARTLVVEPCDAVAQTPLDFERDWRRCRDTPHRRRYLKVQGLDRLRAIWANELDATALGEIIEVLLSGEEEELVLEEWLRALADSDRFDLNRSFIDATVRRNLLARLGERKSSFFQDEEDLRFKFEY
ncbi:hypothetical protein CTAYLR_003022 [Chrysophaeum taylorii]|uniref:Dynein attachment factor N-terminal domain-containing protein n=1 Tax=Chrysophaeum taylorii TaxID=2483200 RepID=A0AAD7U614_9STRA|nr:hypothetical protein CTAYLR_003022 [Chrysophaeum taylorii]